MFGEQEPGLPTYLRGDGRGVFGEQEPGLPTYLRGDGRGVFGEQEPGTPHLPARRWTRCVW